MIIISGASAKNCIFYYNTSVNNAIWFQYYQYLLQERLATQHSHISRFYHFLADRIYQLGKKPKELSYGVANLMWTMLASLGSFKVWFAGLSLCSFYCYVCWVRFTGSGWLVLVLLSCGSCLRFVGSGLLGQVWGMGFVIESSLQGHVFWGKFVGPGMLNCVYWARFHVPSLLGWICYVRFVGWGMFG